MCVAVEFVTLYNRRKKGLKKFNQPPVTLDFLRRLSMASSYNGIFKIFGDLWVSWPKHKPFLLYRLESA